MTQIDLPIIVQGRVLRALIFREAKSRFGRYGVGLFWEFFRIISTIAFYVIIRNITSPQTHRGMEMIPFIATGVLTFYCFRSTFGHVQGAISSNRGLLQFPIVTSLDACISRWVIEPFIYMSASILVVLVMVYFGESGKPAHFIEFIIIILISSFFGFCFGLTFGCIILYLPFIRFFSSFLQRFLMFTSGMFFVLPELPIQLRNIAIYNPVIHLNEFARQAYFQVYKAEYASATYLGIWIILTLLLGLILERASRRRVAWLPS